MKYQEEFASPAGVTFYAEKMQQLVTAPWQVMEICGGQTHSILKNGLQNLLPAGVELIHGPGCPVCVTPDSVIDQAVALARQGVILCSYGDMLRVPGSAESLVDARAGGADVRITMSPLDAVKLAAENPGREVVLFAIGFETTAPGNAQAILAAKKQGLSNFSVLAHQVTVPPAMDYLLSSSASSINGFLAAGHVCTVMGCAEYYPLAKKYGLPVVITGFQPVDIMKGLYHCLLQLENGEARVENAYTRCVREEGNPAAQAVLQEVFCHADTEWRGIGTIPASGLAINSAYSAYDAARKFAMQAVDVPCSSECISGEVLMGRKKPYQCTLFRNGCTPQTPRGAPMVSEEGACAAYYHYTG